MAKTALKKAAKAAVRKPAATANVVVSSEGQQTDASKAKVSKEVYDHVTKQVIKMSQRQYDLLKGTTYTEGKTKFMRYTLGNVKTAAPTK